MSKFSGSALVMQWIYSGGTVTITGKQRTAAINPTINLIDSTAGADAWMENLNSVKSFTASMGALLDDTSVAIEDALAEGTSGTLLIYPAGTASGKRKYTCPAISMGPNVSMPYDNNVEFTNDFTGNGELTRGTV